eukprot:372341-Amphidinium_carterae.1
MRCRYPDASSIYRRCAGCQRGLKSDHRSHTLELGDCRFHDAATQLWRLTTRVRAAPEHRGAPAERITSATCLPQPAPGTLLDIARPPDFDDPAETGLETEIPLTPLRPLLDSAGGEAEERDLQQAVAISRQHVRGRDPLEDRDTTAQSTMIGDDAAAYEDLRRNVPGEATETTTATPIGPIPSTPGRGPDRFQRVRRVFTEEGAQTHGSGHIDWRYFDVDKAMRNLHSASQRTRLLTIRRLHVRWFHCTTSQLSAILRQAGVGEEVIQEIPLVIDSCNVCRIWQRPSYRPKTSFSTVYSFKEELQMDYLFYCSQLETEKQKVILHIIDVATRYTQAILLPDRSEQALRTALSRSWIAVFGVPRCIVVDEECSAHSSGTAEWAEYVGTQLAFKAPRQEAWIIERHNALLRDTLHRMESQCLHEGRHPPFEDVLCLAISAKNSLTSYQGYSPQQAVLGRNSNLLPSITSTSAESAQTDIQQHQRLRELAVTSITEVHSKERIRRAHRHHTTATLTDASYPRGTPVDIWFEPTNKDITGWKGPAEVLLCQPEKGQVTVKWQGRILDRRAAEIRPHVIYLINDGGLLPLADSWTCMRTTLEAFPSPSESPSTCTVGHVFDSQEGAWKVNVLQSQTLSHLMLALLDIRVSYLGIPYPLLPSCHEMD